MTREDNDRPPIPVPVEVRPGGMNGVVKALIVAGVVLVVVVFLGVAGIVVWGWQSGSDRVAQRASCMNHLKQFDIAVTVYMRDCEGERPLWLSNLYPNYISSPAIYVCPEDPTHGHDGGIPAAMAHEFGTMVETDDFAGSDAGSADPDAADCQNRDIKGNSYLYCFCCAECSWWTEYSWEGYTCRFEDCYRPDPGVHPGGRSVLTWREVKEWELRHIGPWTPIIQCYWHGLGKGEDSGVVLNVGAGTRQLYTSGPAPDDWKTAGGRSLDAPGK